MRRRLPMALASIVSLTVGLLLGASSARLTADSDDTEPVHIAMLTTGSGTSAGPGTSASLATPDPMTQLNVRARQATTDAAKKGADITFTLLDRQTGQSISGGDTAPFPIASVAKLFIADDLLVKLVEDRGLRENTVFVYICDNG